MELDRISPARGLAGSDVSIEQVRTLLRHSGRDDAAPGMAKQDQFLFRKTLSQLLGEINSVRDKLFQTHAGGAILGKCAAGTAFVPLYQNEIVFIRRENGHVGRLDIAGTAMNQE